MGTSSRWHLHPCSTPSCLNKIACDGAWIRNFDGWPEAICDLFHEREHGVAYCLPCQGRQEREQEEHAMRELLSDPRRI